MTDSIGVFWDAAIAPHVARSRPHTVFLAGGGDGSIVHLLIEALAGRQGIVHVADAAPNFDVAAARQSGGDRLTVHIADPVDAIGLLPVPDLVLLDADPNWFTVQRLLAAAHAKATQLGQPFPVTLLSGTGWPHGRRDGYRNPSAIPEAFRHAHERAGVRPGHGDLSASGGLFTADTHAVTENEPRNGVLTALEDFLSAERPRIAARTLPFLHGLSVIYPADDARNAAFGDLVDGFAAGSVALSLAEQIEMQRVAAAAELADLRRAFESERYQTKKLREALRGKAPAPAVPDAGAAWVSLQQDMTSGALLTQAPTMRVAAQREPEHRSPEDDASRIELLRASAAFDAAWYLETYRDVAEARGDPTTHYYHYGAAEGRDPGPYFSTTFYLSQNPDVAESGVNPLLHYLTDGGREGRDPNPAFSSRYYLDRSGDVSDAGQNPLEHYVLFGMAEGRETRPER